MDLYKFKGNTPFVDGNSICMDYNYGDISVFTTEELDSIVSALILKIWAIALSKYFDASMVTTCLIILWFKFWVMRGLIFDGIQLMKN